MSYPSKFRLPFLLIALALCAGTAWGQSGTTSIYGEITDASGAAIVGAKVTITNVGSKNSRETTSDQTGRYQFVALQPGTYNLRVEMSGFRAAVRENVQLLVDTQSKVNFAMVIGQLTETVVVSEAAAALNTSDATVGNAFGERPIKDLPLEGRNVVGLLSLQPGAVFLPTNDQRSGSISGARSDQSNVTMDGVDVNDAQFGFAFTTVLRATLDSVQEFRVTTTNYDASQGRSSAAQVSLVTKSGTNDLHGSAYWYHRNTATSSNEYFNKLAGNATPKLQRHIYGASAGGPILKDRLFIFGNFENTREASAQPVTRTVPSNSFRDGVLIYRCASAAACPAATVSGLSGTHQIPAGYFGLTPAQLAAIDPLGIGPSIAASQFFRQYPSPNTPGQDGINGTTTGNIVGIDFVSPITNYLWTWIARADYRLDSHGDHTLFVRGNLQDDYIGGTSQFPGAPPNTVTLNNSRGIAIGYNGVFSSKFVNVFRYGYTVFDGETAGQRTGNISTFRFITHLTGTNSSNGRRVGTHNLVDDLSYSTGNHTWQWGTNIRFTRIPSYTNANSFHTATANGSWVSGVGRTYMPGAACPPPSTAGCNAVPAVASSGQAVYADSLINILGILSQASAIYNYNTDGSVIPNGTPTSRRYASNEYEFYVQDSWRMRPNLTITLGVRYGLFSPPWEQDGKQVSPTIPLGDWFDLRGRNALAGIPSNQAPLVNVDLAGPVNNGPGFYEWDFNDWAPRASFAYSPNFKGGVLGWLTGGPGKTSIRGGYSLVYDRIGHALATQFDAVGSFGLSSNLSSPFGVNNETNPAIRFVNATTLPSTLPVAPPGGFPATPPSGAGVITSSIDQNITTPFSHTMTLVIGREIPGNMTVEMGYVGRRGRNLLIRRDLAMYENLVDPASGVDYFTAAQQLASQVLALNLPASAPRSAYSGIPNMAYWENLFPAANLGLGLSATQEIARRFNRDAPDYSTSLWLMDQFCTPGCSVFGPFAYFTPQYDSLAGQSSLGWSEYHGFQLVVRRRMSKGLQFDFNYTAAKSLDIGSAVERGSSFTAFGNGGYTGFLLNPWDPKAHYGQSDFDIRSQMNFNWIYELPFGKGKTFGNSMNSVMDQIVGGWQVSGLWRWTSGLPFNVFNCRSCWPTNWNLQGNASLVNPGQLPATATTRNIVGGRPSPFVDPVNALTFFRRSLPGEVGLRNVLRGDGYFAIDLGVSKAFKMPWEGHYLKFRWETFNLTNTPRFDTGNLTMFPDRSNFGRYNGTLATCDGLAGRCMQFAFRYEF